MDVLRSPIGQKRAPAPRPGGWVALYLPYERGYIRKEPFYLEEASVDAYGRRQYDRTGRRPVSG